MAKYKKIMLDKGIMQKELLEGVRRVDPRVDKSLLSKMVNEICLPNVITLDAICKTLSCGVLDIYDPAEIELAPRPVITLDLGGKSDYNAKTLAQPINKNLTVIATDAAPSSDAQRKRKRRRDKDLYNLTVEIPRDVAERVFAKSALRKLGYLSKSDFIRQAVAALDDRLSEIAAKEKVVAGDTAPATTN